MMTLEAVRGKRGRLLDLAARHGARNVRVFGSVARGEADAASDLESELGARVDVVTEVGLRPALRDRVLRDTVPL